MTHRIAKSEEEQVESNADIRNATRDNFEYLVGTLSKRTAGKKYENYVINAIWNALGDAALRPVTQQYVNRRVRHRGLALVDLQQERAKGESSKRALIDLYFPAIRLGVECDEAHHSRCGEDEARSAREADKARTKDIQRAVKDYLELRIVVETDDDGFAVSPQAVLDRIDEVVRCIRDRKQEVESGRFDWAPSAAVAWRSAVPDWKLAREAGVLRAGDGLVFRTNGEIRELFGMGADGVKTDKHGQVIQEGKATNHFRANFELPDREYVVWCPTLAQETVDATLRTTNSAGYLNWIIVDRDDVLLGQASPVAGVKPYRYSLSDEELNRRASTSDWEPPAPTDTGLERWDVSQRITFVRTKDALGRTGYQFLGVFTPTVGYREVNGISFEVTRLIADVFELPRL